MPAKPTFMTSVKCATRRPHSAAGPWGPLGSRGSVWGDRYCYGVIFIDSGGRLGPAKASAAAMLAAAKASAAEAEADAEADAEAAVAEEAAARTLLVV